MFDDETEDVGQEIEAYCPRCKIDTTHTVVSRYDDEIRRVRCNSCEDIHAFRRPRGEDAGEEPAEAPARKRNQKAKPTWDQVMAKKKKEPRTYDFNEIYGELDLISHPKFGTGFVSEHIGVDKIEVTFQSDKRILIHNRMRQPLHAVLQQRHEADAKARAEGKKSRELKEARDAARMTRDVSREIEDLIDIPDDLADAELGDGELPDILEDEPKAAKPSRPGKLSAKALAELDEEDAEGSAEGEGGDEEGQKSRRGRGRAKAPAAPEPAKAKAPRPRAAKADKPPGEAEKAPRGRRPKTAQPDEGELPAVEADEDSGAGADAAEKPKARRGRAAGPAKAAAKPDPLPEAPPPPAAPARAPRAAAPRAKKA